MSNFSIYTTRQGQRWDAIANEVYGDPYAYEPIVMANPDYLGVLVLPAGVRLRVPEQEQVSEAIAAELLPPWRR